MTSSKSLRAHMMPSSFSLSALKSNNKDDPEAPSRSVARRKGSFDLPHPHPQHPSARRPRTAHNHNHEFIKHDPMETTATPDLPPRKSKTWSDRVSSLLPTLITSSPETNSIARKPLAASQKPSPVETPPPPPYLEHDPKSLPMNTSSEDSPASLGPFDESAPRFSFEPSPAIGFQKEQSPEETPVLQTEIHQGSFWDERVYPTTTQAPHANHTQESQQQQQPQQHVPVSPLEPSAQMSTQRNGSVDSETDNSSVGKPTSRKLRKQSPDTRKRSSSFQQPQSSFPQPGIKPSATTALHELRGRTVSSQPTLAVTDASGEHETVPPLPSPRRPSQPASPSPTRGRIRRSWMPGGRSRSNSIDVTSVNNMKAWIISDESPTEYNTSFLENGDKVR